MPSGIYKRTKRTLKNMSIAQLERFKDPEERRKSSESKKGINTGSHSEETKAKQSMSRMGIIPWNKGKTGVYSKETREKMSKSRMGGKRSKETKRKMSIAATKRNNCNSKFGIVAEYKNTGIMMRSNMEREFAKLLDKNKIDWEYETYYFVMKNNRTYTPDFYLPESDLFIEVKPKWRLNKRMVRYKYNQVKKQGFNIWFAHEGNPKKTIKYILKKAA